MKKSTDPPKNLSALDLWDDPEKDFRQRYQLPEHYLWGPYDPRMIDYLGYLDCCLELLPSPPLRLLDVGCGDGWVARLLLEKGYDVVGLDYSERAIHFAEILVEGGEFHTGDIRELGTRSEWQKRFDAAIFIEVLEHIPPDYHQDVITSIGRCMRPDGVFIVTVPSLTMPMNRWHYKHFGREEIVDLVESCGFVVEEVINQHRLSWIDNPRLWRLLKNSVVDLVIVQRWLRHLMLTRYNKTDDPKLAGRYVIRARRVGHR